MTNFVGDPSRAYEPIETYYAGFKYRSRTEAKWAYLFDLMGIEYSPEQQGYKGYDKTPYLSDFVLPDFGVSVEIKGRQSALESVEKKLCSSIYGNATPAASGLILLSDLPTYTCTIENPTFVTFPMLYWDGSQICLKRVRFKFNEKKPASLVEIGGVISTSSELAFPKGTSINKEDQKIYKDKKENNVPAALEHFAYCEAKTVRFDHGIVPEAKQVTWDSYWEKVRKLEVERQKKQAEEEAKALLRARQIPMRNSVVSEEEYEEIAE